MENKYKIKICKGCDHLSIVPLLKTNIACCPDSNYVDVEFCKPNERKFLDRMKEAAVCKGIHIEIGGCGSFIFQDEFPDVHLSELLEL